MSLFRKCLLLLALAISFQLALGGVLLASHRAFSLGAHQLEASLDFTSHSTSILVGLIELRQLLMSESMSSPKIDSALQGALNNIRAQGRAEASEGRVTQQQSLVLEEKILECTRLLQETRARERHREQPGYAPHLPWKAMHQSGMIAGAGASIFSQNFLEEQTRAEQLIAHQKRDNQTSETVLCVGMALELLLLALSIAWFKHSTTPKIAAVMRNIQRFAQQQELKQPIPGEDELSTLDRAFYSAATNLNDARLSERDLMERQRDVICRLDESLTFKQINRACAAAFGTPPEELLGKTFAEITHDPEQEAGIKQQFETAKAGRTTAFETRITRPDRSTIEMHTAVSWLDSDHSFVCVMHDITARKHADRLQEELLQMISHDMRTPLTTISGAFEIFEFGGLPQSAIDLLEAGRVASAQMMSLVDHFLKIEKIKAGMFELELKMGSLDSLLLAAAENAVERHAGRPTAAFKIDPSPIELVADRQRMEETLTDIFAVVLDGEPTDGEIAVAIEQSSTEDYIEIRIKPGSGSAQNRNAVQDHSVLERLVLPLCHMIIELHGGRLVQSGTAFTISLPTKGPPRQQPSHAR